MGRWSPPLYEDKDLLQIADAISKIDEKINELAIEREEYAKAFKEKIQKMANPKA